MKRFLGLMILLIPSVACGDGLFSINSYGQMVDVDGAVVVSQPVVTTTLPSVVTRRTVLYVGPYTRARTRVRTYPVVPAPVRVRTYVPAPVRVPTYVPTQAPIPMYSVPFAPVRRAVGSVLNCVGGT